MNHRLVARYGQRGVTGLQNPDRLHYALGATSDSIFDHDQYPSVEEKACRVAFAIAKHHVFVDGNKRTANEVLYLMLELNGKTLVARDEDIKHAIEGVADCRTDYQDFVEWARPRVL